MDCLLPTALFHGRPTPAMEDLRSPDPRVLNPAWELAWPILWSCALGRLRQAWQRGLWDKLDLESCAAESIRSLSHEVAGCREAAAGLQTFPQLINAATRRAWQRSVDMWRHQGRPASLLSDYDGPGPDLESAAAPAALLHDLTAVLECIRAWPQPRRSIFLLTYIEGMNSREVAAALNLTDTNVRTHLFRGREDLWQKFPGMFETSPAISRNSPPEPAPASLRSEPVTTLLVPVLLAPAAALFFLLSNLPSV
jgi:hypothetical protein